MLQSPCVNTQKPIEEEGPLYQVDGQALTYSEKSGRQEGDYQVLKGSCGQSDMSGYILVIDAHSSVLQITV